MKEELFVIIFALVVPFTALFIGYKTKNMGRDEKYNRGRPSCLDESPLRKTAVIPRCTFCHKAATEKFQPESNDLKEQYFCSEECKKAIIEYIAVVNKNGMLFLGLIFGTIFLMVIANGLINALNYDSRYGLLITSIAMTVIGAVIIKFPFCTPQTVQWFGIKKAKIGARCLGFVLIIAVVMLFLKTIAR